MSEAHALLGRGLMGRLPRPIILKSLQETFAEIGVQVLEHPLADFFAWQRGWIGRWDGIRGQQVRRFGAPDRNQQLPAHLAPNPNAAA